MFCLKTLSVAMLYLGSAVAGVGSGFFCMLLKLVDPVLALRCPDTWYYLAPAFVLITVAIVMDMLKAPADA
jgi:hypothetical protein